MRESRIVVSRIHSAFLDQFVTSFDKSFVTAVVRKVQQNNKLLPIVSLNRTKNGTKLNFLQISIKDRDSNRLYGFVSPFFLFDRNFDRNRMHHRVCVVNYNIGSVLVNLFISSMKRMPNFNASRFFQRKTNISPS